MESRSNEPRGYALFIVYSCFPYFPIDEPCNFSSPLHHQSNEFFPYISSVSPEKINLRRLPLHAYHYARLYNSDPLTVLREIRQFKGIDINFNGSVFYARRDSRVISTRAVCMCVCMYGFRKNRVLNLRRKP